MKKFSFILATILMAVGVACMVIAGIGQMHYKYIPAPTDWLFLGFIPAVIGWIIYYRGD